jgi:hypothetical protein
MGEAYGNIKLSPGSENNSVETYLPKGQRGASYIYGYIENSPFHNRDQLGLGRWRKLEMQPAQRARVSSIGCLRHVMPMSRNRSW